MKDVFTIIGAVLVTVVAGLAVWALEGFTLMLALGQVHSWMPAVPAVGYFQVMPFAFWLAAFITMPVSSSIRSNIKKSHR